MALMSSQSIMQPGQKISRKMVTPFRNQSGKGIVETRDVRAPPHGSGGTLLFGIAEARAMAQKRLASEKRRMSDQSTACHAAALSFRG